MVECLEFLLEPGDLVEDDAPVGLDLCLAGASHADTAALSLEVCPESCEAGEQVLVLRELDLCLGGGGLRAAGEYVEDEAGAVEYLDLELFLEVGYLLGGEVVVEYDDSDVVGLHVLCDLLELALADECARVGVVELLCEPCHGDRSGSIGQKLELVEVL